MNELEFDETEDSFDIESYVNIDELDIEALTIGVTEDDAVELHEYFNSVSVIPDLSNDEEQILGQVIKRYIACQSNEEQQLESYLFARKHLIESTLKIVPGIAKKYGGSELGLLELIQEGNLGLVASADKFDPDKGIRFAAFAFWGVRQSIQRAAGNQGTLIRLPIHIRERIDLIFSSIEELLDLEEVVSLNNVASKTGLQKKSIIEALDASHYRHLSLEGLLEADVELDRELSGHEVEFKDDVFGEVTSELFFEQMETVLGTLSDREAGVMRLRFGFGDGQPKTLDEIGKVYGVTRERIRQIESKTMSKLRHTSRSQVLRDYLD